jgi:prevent-host-death family protein
MSSGSVGIRALQQNASAVVSRAASGEIVQVTDRGRPVAYIVPIPQGRLAGLVRAGLARPARGRVAELDPPLTAADDRPSLGDILAEARADER